jgi:hypothetical protein
MDPIHCALSGWSAYGACSASCGGGTQSATRTVTQEAKYNGAPCTELIVYSTCSPHGCPVDCVVEAWGTMGLCDVLCGGGQAMRTRGVVASASRGGKPCPALSEQSSCNTQVCPQPCLVSPWGGFSACSATCGGGTTTATRTVTQEAKHGGCPCPPLTVVTACSEHRCADHIDCPADGACPVDCAVGGWGAFSDCSQSCGAGATTTASRPVLTAAASGGNACPALSKVVACNDCLSCPADCEVSEWGAFTLCTQQCGAGGQATHFRRVTAPAMHGGKACGGLEETTVCNTQQCPVDCEVGAWTDWSACSATCAGGTSTHARPRTVVPAAGGLGCGELTQTLQCNSGIECASHEAAAAAVAVLEQALSALAAVGLNASMVEQCMALASGQPSTASEADCVLTEAQTEAVQAAIDAILAAACGNGQENHVTCLVTRPPTAVCSWCGVGGSGDRTTGQCEHGWERKRPTESWVRRLCRRQQVTVTGGWRLLEMPTSAAGAAGERR